MSFFGRFFMVLLLVISIIETATLAGWLALTTVNKILAIGVLFVGLTAEHIVTYIRANPGESPFREIGRILIVAAVETVSWAVWLVLTGINPVAAVAFLFVTILVGHALEQNTTRNCPGLFDALIRVETLDITAIETVIGVVWLILTGVNPFLAAGVLFMGLHVEHVIAVGKPRRCY